MTSSLTGGERAQEHFRRVCQYCKVKLMERGLQIKKNEQDFDENGVVRSQAILGQVENFLKDFA